MKRTGSRQRHPSRARVPVRRGTTVLGLGLAVLLNLMACGSAFPERTEANNQEHWKDFQSRILEAQTGDAVELPAGTYRLDRALMIARSHLTLRGQGVESTRLQFGRLGSLDAIRILQSQDITFEDLTIEIAGGIGIRAHGVEGLTLRRLQIKSQEAATNPSGIYGVRVEDAREVLVEDMQVQGNLEAGIHLSRSQRVLLRRVQIEGSERGIECVGSEVMELADSELTHNAIGVQIEGRPHPVEANSHHIRVRGNRIYDNNRMLQGAVHALQIEWLPGGIGIAILGASDIELVDNTIEQHNTVGVAILSQRWRSKKFTPGSRDVLHSMRIQVLRNRVSGSGASPESWLWKRLKWWTFGGELPDILVEPAADALQQLGESEPHACFSDNGTARIAWIGGATTWERLPPLDEALTCRLPQLPVLEFPRALEVLEEPIQPAEELIQAGEGAPSD